jgi:hypothetical protein
MKITKRQLRRIIKEENARLEQPDHLAAVLKRDANRGQVTVEEGAAPDELYVMTGGAEGFTIKVLRRGR